MTPGSLLSLFSESIQNGFPVTVEYDTDEYNSDVLTILKTYASFFNNKCRIEAYINGITYNQAKNTVVHVTSSSKAIWVLSPMRSTPYWYTLKPEEETAVTQKPATTYIAPAIHQILQSQYTGKILVLFFQNYDDEFMEKEDQNEAPLIVSGPGRFISDLRQSIIKHSGSTIQSFQEYTPHTPDRRGVSCRSPMDELYLVQIICQRDTGKLYFEWNKKYEDFSQLTSVEEWWNEFQGILCIKRMDNQLCLPHYYDGFLHIANGALMRIPTCSFYDGNRTFLKEI